MANVATGTRLSHMGVGSPNPPEFFKKKGDPTVLERYAHELGALCLNETATSLWMLISQEVNAIHPWIKLYPATNTDTFPCNIGIAIATDDTLQIKGDDTNTATYADPDGGNLVRFKLKDDVTIVGNLTVGSLGTGLVRSDAAGLLSSIPDGVAGEVLIGSSTGIPAWAKLDSPDGSVNIIEEDNIIKLEAVGGGAGTINSMEADDGNIAIPIAGTIVLAGSTNIATSAAINTVTINLKDDVTIPGFLAANTIESVVDTTVGGNLTLSSLGLGVLQSSAAGLVSSSTGMDGEILIGSDAGALAWAVITHGAGLSIVEGPNSIDITATGGGGGALDELEADDGNSAVPVAGVVKLLGDGTATETTAGGDTLVVHLKDDVTVASSLSVLPLLGTVYAAAGGTFQASQGEDSQFYMGVTAAEPEWLTPVSEDGSVTINPGSVAGTLNFQAMASPGAGVYTLSGDVGQAVPDAAGDIKIEGGDNINTVASGKKVTVHLDKSIYQPPTNSTGTEGCYFLNGKRFLHNYAGSGGSGCTFIGEEAGEISFYSGSPMNNTGGGYRSCYRLRQGSYNTAYGANTFVNATSLGNYNIALGYNAGSAFSGACPLVAHNILIGHPGVAGDANTIRIGQQGSGPMQQNKCYIAGIDSGGSLDLTRMEPVLVDQYGKVSTHIASTDGDLLIGKTGAGMIKGKLNSPDNSIEIVNGYGTIDLSVANKPSFRAYQIYNVANCTGDGTVYWLGMQSAFSSVFDTGGDFYLGDGAGARCRFTAPVTGKYYFTVNVLVTNLVAPAPPPPAGGCGDPLVIVTTKRTYTLVNPVLHFVGSQSVFYGCLANMDAGDTAEFYYAAILVGNTCTLGVGASNTIVSGYLASKG